MRGPCAVDTRLRAAVPAPVPRRGGRTQLHLSPHERADGDGARERLELGHAGGHSICFG